MSKDLREGQLGSKLAAYIRTRNGLCIPQVASVYGELGIPDKFITHAYVNFWAELKVLPHTMRQDQLDCVCEFVRHGVNACCISFEIREWSGPDSTKLRVDVFRKVYEPDIIGWHTINTTPEWLLEHMKYVYEHPSHYEVRRLADYQVAKGKTINGTR